MRANHHHFIFFVGARNLTDGVVLHRIVVVKSIGDVKLQLDVFLVLQQSRDAVPLL